jgi:trk system potassium uptake protein TrkH
MAWIRSLPLFVQILGFAIVLMYFPMAFAIRLQDWDVARTLFYYTTFLLILLSLVAIAVSGYNARNTARHYLVTVFAAFLVIPALFALPFDFLIPSIGYFQAYFEMLSCLTTTGATLFDDPSLVPAPLHLMRALVGWIGGFFILVVAISIFAPLQIGGFEIFAAGRGWQKSTTQMARTDATKRLTRYSRQIFPVYLFFTSLLALALLMAGERTLVAVSHAMSILSTSGISPVGGLSGAKSGFLGEGLMFVFLFFAVSRHMFLFTSNRETLRNLKLDKEINIMLICITVIPVLLFVRHWTGALEVDAEAEIPNALAAFWGAVFTVLSFLTTTGFESTAWAGARDWSGLGTTGIILMGLSIMGGGIATTAGGIKLLRIYALFKHGQREVQRLSHPSSVAGSSLRVRLIRREGAQIAWVFLMLFTLSLALVALALTATGISFSDSLIFATAGLSNTGPLAHAAGESFTGYANFSDMGKFILCVAMVLGRLEALAVIALLNPNYWR